MTSPEPAIRVARLLARQWWYGADVDIGAVPAIAASARWCVARLIGTGGQARFDPEDSSIAWMGAGGCYARRLFPVRQGQALSLTLGGHGSPSGVTALSATALTLDGVVVCRAAPGPNASVGAHAPAPSVGDCVGDVIRPGGPGAALAYQGGEAAGDLQDPDSLGLGGVRRVARNVSPPAAFAMQNVVADYGAGGVAGLNGAPGNLWWPPSPSGAQYQVGGPGQAVLEFYDRRPY
jgi:hypothetical protein